MRSAELAVALITATKVDDSGELAVRVLNDAKLEGQHEALTLFLAGAFVEVVAELETKYGFDADDVIKSFGLEAAQLPEIS